MLAYARRDACARVHVRACLCVCFGDIEKVVHQTTSFHDSRYCSQQKAAIIYFVNLNMKT